MSFFKKSTEVRQSVVTFCERLSQDQYHALWRSPELPDSKLDFSVPIYLLRTDFVSFP